MGIFLIKHKDVNMATIEIVEIAVWFPVILLMIALMFCCKP